MVRACLHCGVEFEHTYRRCCSETCANRRRASGPMTHGRTAKDAQGRTCIGCGKGFQRKVGARNKGLYCSRACAFTDPSGYYQRNAIKPLPICPDCGSTRLRQNRYCGSCLVKRKYRYCVACAKLMLRNGKSKTCSPQCRKQATPKGDQRRPVRVYQRTCGPCGQSFLAKRSRQAACSRCAKRIARRGRGKYRERCKRVGAPYTPGITPEAVFTRDGYRCQLCGCSTPKRLRGTYKPNAPELDHIIPIAAGGGHTWDNVQCACRKCNSNKSSSTLGQLRLAV